MVWAHPDDETYLAGGLSAALGELGQRVVCVTATRGEAGSEDQSESAQAQLAETRTRELERGTRRCWVSRSITGCPTGTAGATP